MNNLLFVYNTEKLSAYVFIWLLPSFFLLHTFSHSLTLSTLDHPFFVSLVRFIFLWIFQSVGWMLWIYFYCLFFFQNIYFYRNSNGIIKHFETKSIFELHDGMHACMQREYERFFFGDAKKLKYVYILNECCVNNLVTSIYDEKEWRIHAHQTIPTAWTWTPNK